MSHAVAALRGELKKLEDHQVRDRRQKEELQLQVSALARDVYDRAAAIEDVKSSLARLTDEANTGRP